MVAGSKTSRFPIGHPASALRFEVRGSRMGRHENPSSLSRSFASCRVPSSRHSGTKSRACVRKRLSSAGRFRRRQWRDALLHDSGTRRAVGRHASSGPGASHDYFLPYLLPLARHNRVIFIDERGSGRSQKLADPAGYTIENMVEDLKAARKALISERSICSDILMVGHRCKRMG